jgi:sulfur carrier protein
MPNEHDSAPDARTAAGPTPVTSATSQIRILLNGEPRDLPSGATVAALIAQLGYAAGSVAVERNREVVPRRAHDATELLAGDEVELVTFVGGG